MIFDLQPGRYYAGINRPFFVTEGMVRSALSDYGIGVVRFMPRTSAPPVDPRRDPGYNDAWDEWVEVDYRGMRAAVQVAKQWAWLVFVPNAPALPAPSPSTPWPPLWCFWPLR